MKDISFSDCEILNPDNDLYSISGDELTVSTAVGSMWSKGKECKNLVLAPGAGTAFSASVTVTHFPKDPGQQAGLVLFKDWDNYVKLVRENVGGKHYIVLLKELDGITDSLVYSPFEGSTVSLSLTVDAVHLHAAWGVPGTASTKVDHTVNFLKKQGDIRAGVMVHGTAEGNQAVFTGFRAG